MKTENHLNPNPMVEGPIGYKCEFTEKMRENFGDPEFQMYVSKYLPGSYVPDSDTGTVHFDAGMLDELRGIYRHFFGSTF